MKINWSNPAHSDRELELVKEVIESDYYSEGPKTKELEEKLSKIVKAKHIIMTTSCTSALYLAIEADKKIRNYIKGACLIPNLTFVATKNSVELAGLELSIVDVSSSNYTLYGCAKMVTPPKIIIPVNLLGRNSGLEADMNLTVICDNAGCLGSNVPNGKVGCYSLQANKLISCGQGGFCATDDDEYAKVIRQLKDFGRENKDQNDSKGFNFKFNDIQAAIALGQLSNLTERKVKATNQYLTYREELCKYGEFIDFDLDNKEVPLWIEFKCKNEDERDELYEFLKNNNIDTRKPWKAFIQDAELYPNSMEYQNTILWLPNGFGLKEEDLQSVIGVVKSFYVHR